MNSRRPHPLCSPPLAPFDHPKGFHWFFFSPQGMYISSTWASNREASFLPSELSPSVYFVLPTARRYSACPIEASPEHASGGLTFRSISRHQNIQQHHPPGCPPSVFPPPADDLLLTGYYRSFEAKRNVAALHTHTHIYMHAYAAWNLIHTTHREEKKKKDSHSAKVTPWVICALNVTIHHLR